MSYDISCHNISHNELLERVMFMSYSGGPMTEAMYYVLLALLNPGHGYRLMSAVSEISAGRVKMGSGTLYGVLTRMQKDGLIRVADDDGRRKTYAITEEGKSALREEYARIKAMAADGAVIERE